MAARLAAAQRTGQAIDYDPSLDTPPDIATALLVQQSVAGLNGESVVGWKIGHNADGTVSAPIYRRCLGTSEPTDANEAMPAAAHRHWPHASDTLFGIEFELAIRLTPDAIACSADGLDEFRPAQHVLAVHLGIELLGSRFRQYPDIPFTSALADNLNQAGYLLGPEIDPAVLHSWHSVECALQIDGTPVYAGRLQHPNGNPLAPLPACLADQGALLPGLSAARFLTTGNLCGCFEARNRRDIQARLDGFGQLACRLG